MSGFGTVVTGTLRKTVISPLAMKWRSCPQAMQGRVRGLQTHKKKEETAVPGSRTAVNISGVDMELIRRGEVVVHPNQYQATRRIDAVSKLLNDIHKP
jgi:selenocysteine-specific elongation factor